MNDNNYKKALTYKCCWNCKYCKKDITNNEYICKLNDKKINHDFTCDKFNIEHF